MVIQFDEIPLKNVEDMERIRNAGSINRPSNVTLTLSQNDWLMPTAYRRG